MNFVHHIEYKPKKQIWRIIISDDEKVIIEKRDTSDKQVYFDGFELESKDKSFSNLQLDEKFWIGIEKVYKGIIYFHKYPKPDMPEHSDIIAYEIESGKVLWQNDEYSYLFIHDDKLYCFKQQFEGRRFYTLDYKSGELIEDLGSDANAVNQIYDKSRLTEDFSEYNFPETAKPHNPKLQNLIEHMKNKLNIIGEVEYSVFNNSLFASYHVKVFENSMLNKFSVVDLDSEEELFNETLSSNTSAFMTDSFFIYKNFLFLLKGKDEVIIYKIV